jgi:hypothetical protein
MAGSTPMPVDRPGTPEVVLTRSLPLLTDTMVSMQARSAQMKQFRQGVEKAAPICENCDIEMTWLRSILVAENEVVAHVFTCPKCDRIAESETPAKSPKE